MKFLAHFLSLFLFSTAALADLDINRATQAELERLRGVGPQLSARILTARASQSFSDWDDVLKRVPGLGPLQSVRLSQQGLTVAGTSFAATDSMLTPLKKPVRPFDVRSWTPAP
ncbi:MAG: helix-hairpin-helix domain-containing protein [Betaproteobacteria bacterium]|jgi:competence protein ComEA